MFKIKSRYLIIPVIVMLVAVGTVWAQPKGMHPEGMEKHMPMIPDMTEEQKEQIEESRTEHLKVMLPLKNQLTEKHARLNTLSTAEKVNMKEIYKMIEEIGELKIKAMKEHAAHRQEVRKLLTEEQRLVFDMHPMPHRSRPHPHMK